VSWEQIFPCPWAVKQLPVHAASFATSQNDSEAAFEKLATPHYNLSRMLHPMVFRTARAVSCQKLLRAQLLRTTRSCPTRSLVLARLGGLAFYDPCTGRPISLRWVSHNSRWRKFVAIWSIAMGPSFSRWSFQACSVTPSCRMLTKTAPSPARAVLVMKLFGALLHNCGRFIPGTIRFNPLNT
jgi:hypothetical protein